MTDKQEEPVADLPLEERLGFVPASGNLSIVTTTRAKYFGMTSESSGGVRIENAYEIPANISDPQRVARNYMCGVLRGDLRPIQLSESLVESIQEATDETRIVRSMETMLPDARRRAAGQIVYEALDEMLNASTKRTEANPYK